MDKETLSNYGWIVIAVMVLAVMIALATPFGTFVSSAIKSTTQGLFDVNQSALNSTGLITIDGQEFEEDNSITKEKANIFDSSKYLGNKDINLDTGKIGDNENMYLYGTFKLTVGETYTYAKDTSDRRAVWVFFFNEDGSYAGNASQIVFGANDANVTFTAEYPICYVQTNKEIATPDTIKIVKGDSVPADEGTEVFF